jgi:hypothetical protein
MGEKNGETICAFLGREKKNVAGDGSLVVYGWHGIGRLFINLLGKNGKTEFLKFKEHFFQPFLQCQSMHKLFKSSLRHLNFGLCDFHLFI